MLFPLGVKNELQSRNERLADVSHKRESKSLLTLDDYQEFLFEKITKF